MASLAKYGLLKAVACVARLALPTRNPKPDRVLNIPSRDEGRSIKTHVYDSARKSTGPAAVLINFHGSGWLLPCHGESDEYCRLIATSTDYTILDASYRLAPEVPYPGALNDGEDVINYVLANPDLYDHSRIVISGSSAGGHTALVLASTIFPAQTFSRMVLFYPPVDLDLPVSARSPPDPAIAPALHPKMLSFIMAAYFQDKGLNMKDPRISPIYAQLDRLPKQMAIFTAGADNLMPEVERYVKMLRDDDLEVTCRRFDKCNHGFDVRPCKPGSVEEKAKDEAYSMVVALLQH
jgi:acetyl esterase/lipase